MLPTRPRIHVLLLLALASCHARVDSTFETPPAPPPGSGNVTINMSGGWRVTAVAPVSPPEGAERAPGVFGLMPPRRGVQIGIADDRFAVSGNEPLRRANMPEAGEWRFEKYVNLATGRVAYYRLVRARKPRRPPERQEVEVVAGAVDEHRMLAFVRFRHADELAFSGGVYLVELRR